MHGGCEGEFRDVGNGRQAHLFGCYPPDWNVTATSDGCEQMCPPGWHGSCMSGCVPDGYAMEPGAEPEHFDPYNLPNPEYPNGLSAAECLAWCNEQGAGCCQTEDGEYKEDERGDRDYEEAPYGCVAREHDGDWSWQRPFQNPRETEWRRVTTTKVEPVPDLTVITPDQANLATCTSLCENEMSCGGYNLDEWDPINCYRYDLRPGAGDPGPGPPWPIDGESRCLARPHNEQKCREGYVDASGAVIHANINGEANCPECNRAWCEPRN